MTDKMAQLLLISSLAMLAGLFNSASQAAESLPGPLIKSLQHIAAKPGFVCAFEQVLTFTDATKQQYRGGIAVSRPNRFRWHYTSPYEQLYVGNGKRVWHYEPDLNQVRVLKNLQDVDPAVMRLLSGSIGLASLTLLKQDADLRHYHVRIQNGPDAWLGLNDQGLIAFVETRDTLGNRNRIMLHDCSFKSPNANLFIFQVPDGVDVVTE